jgi:long-chain acyl-CoA synthetase
VAKGAMLTHRNLVANMQQSSAWISKDCVPGKEIIITALPLYHIFALTSNCLVFMKFGGLNYLITNPRDMKAFVKEIAGSRFTAITGVNTLFNGLLHTPGFEKLDFSTAHLALGGGMAVQRAVAERWKQVTGLTLVEAYGLTETSPACCMNPLDLAEYNGAIGVPIPSTDVVLKDEEGNIVSGPDAVGELCVKGPQVMAGYWQRPEETAKVIDADGWLHTGDLGVMRPDGYVQITGRLKDMIIRGGENIYPREIEDLLSAHPDLLDAAVFGVPDEKWGEQVAAAVRVKPGSNATDESFANFLDGKIARHKIPKLWMRVDALPTNASGKVQKFVLRDMWVAANSSTAS